MFLLSFLFSLYINSFEVSQRLKGLGPEFAHIISDTVTDLVYEPGLTSFLSNPLLFAEFQADTTPAYRLGYFSPSLIGNLSYGIYLESAIKKFQDPILYSESLFHGWIRGIFSLSYTLSKGKIALSVGGDITYGNDSTTSWEYRDFLPYISLYRYKDYKLSTSLIKKSGKFPIRVTIEYKKGRIEPKDYYLESKRFSYYIDTTEYADTLVYIYEEWYEYREERVIDEKESTNLFGLTLVSSILPSEKRKTMLFSSLKIEKEDQDCYYARYYNDWYFRERTWIWEDSTCTEWDESTAVDIDTFGYESGSRRFETLSVGIGQENRLNDKTSLFVGLKLSISTKDKWERLSIPLGMEYKASNQLLVRAGVTMCAKRKFRKFKSWNKYHFGIRFSPVSKLNIDLSNHGDLTELNNWQLGLIKTF